MPHPVLTADDLHLETDRARALADLPLDARRDAAMRALVDRRADLALYVDAYAEVHGTRPNLDRLIARDEVALELATLAVA